ncbi:urate hydroxylase PuuD [Sphingomonas sp. LB-2]|uniref:urate hydroxylase PuuD n=1 Tax=Sphingomonas caeni TaxID=2984949 RepID=UPI0022324DDE|nr:urate hydroxylase PuuD [Sphingomonas caeni]MCW3848329.1 urate hydroxylase PuuD [Sphingomonas caeni]
MDKILGNLHLVLLIGVVLALGLIFSGFPQGAEQVSGIFQWLHVFFGITWIGLLYYFNFVQIPTMPSVPAELKPGVTKYIAPKALFFFRWAAVFTVITGAILAYLYGELHSGLLLEETHRLIGVGMWLALIMATNVWVVIWPNQKKALGIVAADDAAKAKAAKVAMYASRINTMLSIPMLVAMTNAH